jgi:hypothetical protein
MKTKQSLSLVIVNTKNGCAGHTSGNIPWGEYRVETRADQDNSAGPFYISPENTSFSGPKKDGFCKYDRLIDLDFEFLYFYVRHSHRCVR